MLGKKKVNLIIVALFLATIVSACGDNTATPVPPTAVNTTAASATTAAATTGAATTSAATGAATTASATTAAAGASDLYENVKFDTNGKKGGQLVYTFAGQFPAILQPYFAPDNVAIELVHTMYATIIGQSANNKYYAYLITQIPTIENGGVKVAADGKSMDVTLTLKPGLKWSDGSALTSKDLAYTWKWVTDPDNGGIYSDRKPWGKITAVETPNDTTAVLKFNQVYGPYLNFLYNFTPLPEKVWSKISIKDDPSKSPEANKPTVTSGPFKMEDFAADDRVIVARNDNFTPVWGLNAYLDKIVFKAVPDTTAALAAVSKGDLDEAENLDDNQGAAATKVPNAKYDIAQQYSWEYLSFNLSNPLFQDAAVRKALSISIDREALIKQFRTPKTVPLAVAFAPFSPFADKSLAAPKYDVEAAKALLDQAGWKVGSDGIRAKDGKKLSFTLSSTTAPVRVATAEVLLTYWKALGVDAKFQSYKSSEFFGAWGDDGILARGKFDVGMYAQVADIDQDGSYGNYHSNSIPSEANKGDGGNYGRINDPIIDKALDDQRSTTDQAKRKADWLAFQKALFDNTYEAALYTRVNNFVVSNKVQNFKANPTTEGNLWNSVELYLNK